VPIVRAGVIGTPRRQERALALFSAGPPLQPAGIDADGANRGGTGGFSGDGGPAVNAQLYYPTDVVVDNAGNIYIADYESASEGSRRTESSAQ
jgi:hypothetical protein